MELHRCRGGGKWIRKGIRMEEGLNKKERWNYIDVEEGQVKRVGK
jgi:hypothetical protein